MVAVLEIVGAEMKGKVRVYLLGCIACGNRYGTLRKLSQKDPTRICTKCYDLLRKNGEIMLHTGKFKLKIVENSLICEEVVPPAVEGEGEPCQ